MNTAVHTAVILIALASASLVFGHGTPIHVSIDAGRLAVSDGVPNSTGFASPMYVEDDEDGEPFGEVTLPQFGPVVVWQIPGLDIFGMDEQSNLSIEVLLRPVANATPQEYRTLWYWNPQTEKVEPAAGTSSLHLLARDNQSLTLAPGDVVAPTPLLLSDPMTGQVGFHNHGLLSYALDNDPAPPAGAYGFFARLTSSQYEASDPFLIVFNRSMDYSQMIPAALAINAAAFLAGDYNHNDVVDAADYVVWRKLLGSMDDLVADGDGSGTVDELDYIVWRQNFGSTFPPPSGSGSAAHSVPEPNELVLILLAVSCWQWCPRACKLR